MGGAAMTTLLPTALEAAAKAFQTAYHEHADTLDGYESMLAAAITAYLAQARKEGWVMVPVGLARKVTSIARRNEDAPEITELSALLAAAQNGGE